VLGGRGTLMEETLARVRGEVGALSFAPPIVLCNALHADLVASQLAGLGVLPAAIVLEPAVRNTAAVAAVAAALAEEIEPGALVLLLPSDHVIADRAAFLAAVERAAPHAGERIVTFGINPDRPETGYGYIKRGAELSAGVFAIETFREKPSAATAREYLEHGGYSWNSGIFLFSSHILLEEFAPSAAIRDAALEALKLARRQGVEIRLDEAAFAKAPAQPLDIAVMEKTERGAVAPSDFGWADLGSWDEIYRLSQHDSAGNAVHGRVAVLDGENNLLRADGVKLCVAGVSDLIVVATGDAVLILPRGRAQDVRALKDAAEKL
jgi:mannose-1-phosphate guanylyltransferase/mannose-6-phosphate isomerase